MLINNTLPLKLHQFQTACKSSAYVFLIVTLKLFLCEEDFLLYYPIALKKKAQLVFYGFSIWFLRVLNFYGFSVHLTKHIVWSVGTNRVYPLLRENLYATQQFEGTVSKYSKLGLVPQTLTSASAVVHLFVLLTLDP